MLCRTPIVVALTLVLVAATGYGVVGRSASALVNSAQEAPATWLSTMLWRPTLAEAGEALAEVVNQIDAACLVDVDPIVAASGSGPEGAVYAFAITWVCPSGATQAPDSTWQSATLWRPTLGEAGEALAEMVNQIDAFCSVDVDPVVAANGPGPEGAVYAFAITWACR